MALTITSANVIFMLAIPPVVTTAQRLQMFGVNEAFEAEQVDAAEVQTGVDGVGVAGWIPRNVPMTITLSPASPSFVLFEDWISFQDVQGDVIYANAVITIPALRRKYTAVQGALTRYPSLAGARRVLEQRQFQITWMPPGGGIPAITPGPA